MKKFIIEIEVDNNITLEDVESAISEMIDNYLDTTNGFYGITDLDELKPKKGGDQNEV